MSDSRPATVTDLLERLQVPRHSVIYVQASADWIQRAGFDAAGTLAALLSWIGDRGTLVMPSYPFHTTHQQYLESRPVYDVRRTAAGIGLLPEMFRRTKGTRRSLDPDFCVTALGAEAAAIVGDDPAAPDPFGPDSSYQRMLDRRATLVGLGVSLNTNSFIHLIDSRAEPGYPEPVYGAELYRPTVIDAGGGSREVMRKALRPAFQQETKPSAVAMDMHPSAEQFATIEIDGARFFRWDLAAWASWCLIHAAQRAAAGAWPCWLSALGHQTEAVQRG